MIEQQKRTRSSKITRKALESTEANLSMMLDSEAFASTYNNLDLNITEKEMNTKKVTAKIEVKRLPKYYSSKLITRN